MSQRYEGKQGIGGEVEAASVSWRVTVTDARKIFTAEPLIVGAAIKIYTMEKFGIAGPNRRISSGMSRHLWEQHFKAVLSLLAALEGREGGE